MFEITSNSYQLVSLYVSLPSVLIGGFRYSVLERRWTQMLTSSVEEGSTPSPRYHHASALLASHEPLSDAQGATHNLMLVVGGVTQKGVAMDTWSLNLSSLVWRQHKVRVGLFSFNNPPSCLTWENI